MCAALSNLRSYRAPGHITSADIRNSKEPNMIKVKHLAKPNNLSTNWYTKSYYMYM